MKQHRTILLSAMTFSLFLIGSLSSVASTESYSIRFFGLSGCSSCEVKYQTVTTFVSSKSNVVAQYFWIPDDLPLSNYEMELQSLGYTSPPPPPTIVLNRSGVVTVLFESDITAGKLELWWEGSDFSGTDYTIWVAFISGVVVGASACMLLLIGILGSTLLSIESRRKYISISIAFLCGLITTYCLVTVLYTATIEWLNLALYFKYIFGITLLVIGIWQAFDFRREKSRIFGTPEKVKGILRDFIQKRSTPYAFLVGVIFAFIKIPCFGGPYFNLLYTTRENPLQLFLLSIYILGMLLPIIGVLIALRLGAKTSRIEEFRKNNRAYLRLLSGIFIATLAVYLLWDTFISMELLLWIILGEIIGFVLLIWLKNKRKEP